MTPHNRPVDPRAGLEPAVPDDHTTIVESLRTSVCTATGQGKVIIRPAFHGIDLTIKGRDRQGIKDYLHQTYEHALTRLYVMEYDSDKGYTFAYVPGEAA